MSKILATIDVGNNILVVMNPEEAKEMPRAIFPSSAEFDHTKGSMQWSGTINIKLMTAGEHEVAFHKIDGMAISFMGTFCTARVTNNFGQTFVPAASITDA